MSARLASTQRSGLAGRQTARVPHAKRPTVCMGRNYCVGPAYLVRVQPLTLYPDVLKAIQDRLEETHGAAACDIYNTRFKAFEVASRVRTRRLHAVEPEMPVDWIPRWFCTPSKNELPMTDAEAAILKSLEASLEQHGLSVVSRGWCELEYTSW